MHKQAVDTGSVEPPAIWVEGATKRFGSSTALAGLDLQLRPGEWLGLLGANGAGKTTAMHAIAGLIDLDDGSIEVFGHRVHGPTPQLIGWVPQEIALYSHLTARENLEAFGRLHGLRGTPLGEAVRWALGWTGLQSRAEERIVTFSGGMQRRLNIACGVLHRPRVLLLDEPTVGVDPQSRERILDMLEGLRENGTALLQSTHEFGDLERTSDRLVIMDEGRTIASGTVEELVDQTVGDHAVLTLVIEGTLLPEDFGDGVVYDDSTVTTTLHDVAEELPRLLAAVQRAGGHVVQLDVRRPGIAEVFMELTGRELRE